MLMRSLSIGARISLMLALALITTSVGLGCRGHSAGAPAVRELPTPGGLTIVHQDGKNPLETFYVDSDRIRVERGTQGFAAIVDARAQRILILFGDKRAYAELGPKEVAAAPPLIPREELEQTKKELEKAPPEQRKRAEALLAMMAGGDPELSFQRTNKRRTVNGIACEVYRVGSGGDEPLYEECISPWSDGIFRREDFAALAVYYRSVMNAGAPGQEIFQYLDFYPGFPVAREILDFKTHEPTPPSGLPPNEIKSVKRGPLPDSLFNVPAGYTRTEQRHIQIVPVPPPDPGPPINL
jgi:hypothetical protein